MLTTDAVEQHLDLLKPLMPARTYAERQGLDALAFGQQMTYSFCQTSGTSIDVRSNGENRSIVEVSLLSIDPYGHHVVASVQLMRRAIDRDLATKKLDAAAYARSQTVMNRALELLPGSSKSVQAARMDSLAQHADGQNIEHRS